MKRFACFFYIIVFNPVASMAAEIIMEPWHGVAIFSDVEKGKKSIFVDISREDMLNSFSFWKQQGGLRSESTETEFRSRPYSYAVQFALYSVSGSLHGPTSKFDGSPMRVVGELIEPDDYGHFVKHQIFSFTFTKIIDSKIEWSGFDALSFQKIAPDFTYSSWFGRNYRREPLK